MIVLFISKGELIASLILVILLAIYAWGRLSLAKLEELDAKIRGMSDAELIDRFQSFMKDNESKLTHREGQEIYCILKAIDKRGLLKNVSDKELIDQFTRLKADYEKKQNFWKWKKADYLHKEMEKRHLL